MKKFAYFSFPIFLYLLLGIYASRYNFTIFESVLKTQNASGYYDYRGVTHVHTNKSTGSLSHAMVIQAAKDADQDFIIFTDLNDFSHPRFSEGYDGSLLVLHGQELSYLDSHILYYEEPKSLDLTGMGQTQVHLTDMLSQKRLSTDPGFFVLAHPFKSKYHWSGDYPIGLDGIEVLNLMRLWEQAWQSSKLSVMWSGLLYPFNPELSLIRLYEDPSEELDLWDKLTRKRPTIGMGGSDATARIAAVPGVHFPSYQRSFGLMSNHILLTTELTGSTSSDKNKTLQALKGGHFYMAFDALGLTKGFVAELRTAEKRWLMGSSVKWTPGLELNIRLPQRPMTDFEVVVMKDGQRFMTSNSQLTQMNVLLPGVYRVMVRVIPFLPLPDGKRWFTWILTNPFYVQ